VADTLNNLAVLYDKLNRMEESKEAYIEALKIRRELVKIIHLHIILMWQ